MKSRRIAGPLFLLLIITSFGMWLHGAVPDVPTGQWLPGPALAQPRTGAVSVGLDDGRVLVIGGRTANGPVDTVEVFNTNGTMSLGAQMLSPRSGHTATKLPDGSVLVVGGTTWVTTEGENGPVISEAATASAELFDPVANAWYLAASLSVARSGATATALADGHVVVAGGAGGAGAVLDTFEIFDSESGAFSTPGVLWAARAEHAAAVAGASKVIVAGGRNAGGVLASADIIDVSDGSVAPVVLTAPRAGASATALLDGKILVAGGSDGNQELASAEVVDPLTGVSAITSSMAQARRDHQALLLANNNTVLITGGRSGGAVVSGAEQFVPWADAFSATSSPTPRASAIVSNLTKDGVAWLAAGRATENAPVAVSELYGFATLKTDSDDYAPGTTVVITGSGWQPGETVALILHEVGTGHADRSLTAVADGAGGIRNTAFAPDVQHIGVRFYLTARGAASQAQLTFTDAVNTASPLQFFTVSVGTCSNTSAVSGQVGTPICASSTVGTNNGNTNNNFVEFLWFRQGEATAAFIQRFPASGVLPANSSTVASSIQMPDQAGSWTVKICQASSACSNPSSNTLRTAALSVVASNRTLTITGSGVGSGNVTSSPAGINCTVVNGATSGSCSGSFGNGAVVTLSATPSAGAPTAAGSTFDGWTGDGTGATTRNLTMDADKSVTAGFKANQTITFGALANKTYGDADFTVSAAASSGLTVTFAGSGNCTVTGNSVHIAGAGSCTITASQAGNSSYNAATDVGRSFTIAKAATTTTVTCDAGPFVFNGSAQTPCSAAVTGPALSQTLTVSYSNNVAAGTATASATYAESANYLESSDSQNFTIAKAATTTMVTCDAGPFVFNGSAQTPCSAAVTGPALSQTLTVSYSNNVAAGTATASATYAESANYLESSDSQNFTIAKAATTTTVTCDAGPFVFNGSVQTPCSAAVTGPALNQTLTVSYSNNVDVGTATASATYAESANYLESSDSQNFTIAKAATTTTVTCDAGPFVFNGSAQTPCSAAVTGPALSQTLTVSYSNNVAAGTATASATYAESANYLESSDSQNFTIAKAATTTTVTCDAGPFVFNGSVQTPCSAAVTGPALNQTLTVSYSNNVDVGTATASATYAESANYLESSDSQNFTIAKAATTTTVTCDAGPFVFNGSAQTPCSAAVTGPALNQTLTVSYSNNVAAGTATASATYAESANYLESSDSQNFTIAKAATTTTVTCDAGPFVFNGSVQTPCSAAVTGPALNQTLTVSYSNNVDVGTATASATYAESANYLESSDSQNFTIAKAATTTTVTCDAGPFVFNGSAQTPCSAAVTGPALSQTLTVSYTNNVDAGTATASASYGESANHLASSGSTTFTIGRAPTTTTVTCTGGPFTYTAAAQTPCSAAVTGPALNQALTVGYSNNVDAGTATASASYGESANHLASSRSATFTIDKASSATAITCPSGVAYTGALLTPCTAGVTGVGGLNQSLTVSYTSNTNPGTANANASYAGDSNHTSSSSSKTFSIGYGACSPAAGPGGVVLQPINTDGTSVFGRKGGSTIPVKFRVCDASANPIANAVAVFAGTGGSLTMLSAVRGTIDGVNEAGVAEIPDAAFRYSGGQWIYNMATNNLTPGTTYQFQINLAVGNIIFKVAVK